MPPTFVFDSDCILCSRWVHLILKHERDREIIFVSAWSQQGEALAAKHSLSPHDLDATYMFILGMVHDTIGDNGPVSGRSASPRQPSLSCAVKS